MLVKQASHDASEAVQSIPVMLLWWLVKLCIGCAIMTTVFLIVLNSCTPTADQKAIDFGTSHP
ncbi:MAG: hypothetical protein ABIO72_02760 [Patescibacteria group bacterium]